MIWECPLHNDGRQTGQYLAGKGVKNDGLRISVWGEKDCKKSDKEKGNKEITSISPDEGGQSGPPFFRPNGIPPLDIDFCDGL